MDDLERATRMALPRDSAYVTLSGLFLHSLGRLPMQGDAIEVGDWRIEVESLERRRVGRALFTRREPQAEA